MVPAATAASLWFASRGIVPLDRQRKTQPSGTAGSDGQLLDQN
jgi:hypothetical protein